MPTYPTSPRSAFLAWCQAHAPVWETHSSAIGLEEGQASDFTAAVAAAAAAMVAQEQAKQTAKAAAVTTSDQFSELRSSAANLVRIIRTFAEQQPDPNTVYTTAQIPPPAQPSPMAPPGKPTDLTVTLDASSGDLLLRWKVTNPPGAAGTAYIVKRKLPGESAFSFVGVTGSKKFVDQTFFSGPDSVQYTVQGQRSDSTGPVSEIFTVNFGKLPGGGFTAFVTSRGGGGEDSESKLAA